MIINRKFIIFTSHKPCGIEHEKKNQQNSANYIFDERTIYYVYNNNNRNNNDVTIKLIRHFPLNVHQHLF